MPRPAGQLLFVVATFRSMTFQQRHVLESVPFAKVTFRYGGKQGVFWVYGQERQCYVPNYPSKCAIL